MELQDHYEGGSRNSLFDVRMNKYKTDHDNEDEVVTSDIRFPMRAVDYKMSYSSRRSREIPRRHM